MWALISHSPLLSAISFPNLSAINNLEVLAFYLICCLTVVAGYSLTYLIWRWIPYQNKIIFTILFLSVAEYIRGFILSLLFWGHESTVGISDATFSVANALSMTPLLSLAYFGHIYYLSFILSLIIICLHNKKLPAMLILIILISLQIFYVYYKNLVYQEREKLVGGSNYPDINMLIIPTHMPTHIDTTQMQLQNIYNKANKENDQRLDYIIKNNQDANLVILPETIIYKPSLNTKIKYKGPPILQGLVATDTDKKTKLINASLYIDPQSGITIRKKSYLFPFYEYRPYLSPINSASSFSFGSSTPTDFYTDINKINFLNLPEREKIYRWTTMICSEFFYFDYIKDLKNKNYDLIFAQSSFSIFNQSRWMYAIILMSQKINSAYIGVPLIQVSNDGPSFVIKNNKLIYFEEKSQPFTINVDK